MDHSQVVKYFDDYIKKYAPYQDNEVYSSLMEYISSTFTKELYENIPERFKQLYEDNYIHISMYDTLLRNIGVPDKILNKLSINEKIILFKNFTDFYRYRGDIYFFDKVSKLFEYTSFDIYELYIDYDEDIQDWVFKPYELIKNTTNPTLEITINYEEIYNSIPSFLINKQQLSTYRSNKEIILPIKSNIVLLDYSFIYNISEMINLINATFLKQYKTNSITCYFTDTEFVFTLKTFYIVWYYILLKTYGSFIGNIPIQWVINYIESINPYSLTDIDQILQEYENITNAYDGRLFYEKYIRNVFLSFTYSDKYESSDLEYLLTTEFIEYIDNRVTSGIVDDKQTYNVILDELLNSLILYISSSSDELFIKYSEYFINSLTRITLNPEDTSSYLLLHNYKPFHTELLSSYNDIIFSNSNFDIITPNDEKIKFFFDLQLVEIFNLIDFHIDRFIYHDYDNFQILDFKYFNIIKLANNYLTELEEFNIDTHHSFINFNNIIDNSLFNYIISSINQLQFTDFRRLLINKYYIELLNLNDDHFFKLFNKLYSNYNVSDFILSKYLLLNYQINNICDKNIINVDKYIYNNTSILYSNFNFNNTTNLIISFNLNNYVGLGFNGLNIGDLVKYINDEDIHYRRIIGFDLIYNYIILDSNYTGSNCVGYLIKKSSMSDNYIFNQNYINNDNLLNNDNYNMLLTSRSVLNLSLSNNYVFDQNYLFSTSSSMSDNYIFDQNYINNDNLLISDNYLITQYLTTLIIITQNINTVLIECDDNVILYYTTDGTDPTFDDIEYINPIILDGFTTLKVIAYKSNDVELRSFSQIETFYPDLSNLPTNSIVDDDNNYLIYDDDNNEYIY